MHPGLPSTIACVAAVLALNHAQAEPAPGDYTFEIKHGGRTRNYILHVPRDTLVNPWPVVLSFHGGGSSAAGQQSYSRLDETADREGFLAVYPNGTGRFSNRLLSWNAGTCCGYALSNKVDDVGFVHALIDDLEKHANIDRTRIYATGLSNGAMMAYRIAEKAPGLLAAIAPIAGAEQGVPFEPKAPISIMHIHSVDDTRALYAGGIGPPYPLTNTRTKHPAVEKLLSLWAAYDGCPAVPVVEPPIRGAGSSALHTATRVTYGPCRDDVEIVLWKLTGAGHVWPDGAHDYLDKMLGSQSKVLGPPTDVIDADTQIWQFVSRFHTNVVRQTPD